MQKIIINKCFAGTVRGVYKIAALLLFAVILFAQLFPMISANAAAEENVFYIRTDDACLTVDLADSAAARELKDLLEQGDLTISMTGNSFEQYGSIGRKLTAQDTSITAQPGDVLLYNADTICVFYGTNRYSYTRLGTVRDADSETLRILLSGKDLTMTLSLRSDTANAPDEGQSADTGSIIEMIRQLIRRILQFFKALTAGFSA